MSSFRIKGVNPDWKGSKVRKKGRFTFGLGTGLQITGFSNF